MIYHTSQVEIKEIEKYYGVFDDVLFFSSNVYQMSAGSVFVYKVDDSKLSFIDASDLDSVDAVESIIDLIGCNEDEAQELLNDELNVFNIDFDGDYAEASWAIQVIQARAAKEMGYDGVISEDEQGVVYMIRVS